MPPRPPPRRSASGFALIEMIMAMGIGLLIAAAVWQVYAERRAIAEGTAAGNAVEGLIALANDAYATNVEFATVNAAGTKTFISIARLNTAINGELPVGVYLNGAVYNNRWGGTWAVAAISSGGTPRDLLRVTATLIPHDECQVMLGKLAPFVYDTTVNGTLVHLEKDPTSSSGDRSSVDIGQAMPLCRASNTMVFRTLKDLNLPDLRRIWPYPDTLTPEEQGLAPSDRYREAFLDHYNRIEAAMAAREAAQAARD